MENVPQTIRKALEAYRVIENWTGAARIEAVVSTSGLLFLMKGHRPFRRISVSLDIAFPRVRFQPVDSSGFVAVLDGGTARIETEGGHLIAERPEARRYFRGFRRQFYWDRLDHAYFSGYALWNYLTFPALLLREDIAWRETSSGVMEARFPDTLPTHCPVQQFIFDPGTGLLRQHDYTAEVIGSWARAANVVLAHRDWAGIPYPAHRRVTPLRPDGRPRPFPTLVDITVHEWRLI
jgi:hypothetical protein